MKPVEFPEQNCTYTADKCLPLPACRQMNEEFQTIGMFSVEIWAEHDHENH